MILEKALNARIGIIAVCDKLGCVMTLDSFEILWFRRCLWFQELSKAI